MPYPLQRLPLHIENQHFSVFTPEPYAVQQQYVHSSESFPDTPFPYWAKLWPSAIALAHFLLQHPQLITGKKVLEIAGGIGLPSLVAAQTARQVVCSDISEEAVQVAALNARDWGIDNMQCHCFSWKDLPANMAADVLLLSDVNYDPRSFDDLKNMLLYFLKQGTTILISTPIRVQARQFLEGLMPYCQQQQVVTIAAPGLPEEEVYVFKLLPVDTANNN